MNDAEKYMFCTKCKTKTLTTDLGTCKSKNDKNMLTGFCNICRTKKQEFTKSSVKKMDTVKKDQSDNETDSDDDDA